MWDKFEYLGSILSFYALCECATGHKQAGMFLLEDFQEAPTIWWALWGFPPSCYIYCTYASVCACGIDFKFVSYWLNTPLPLTLALFPLLLMPNTCCAQAPLVWPYHSSARRSFAWVTIAHLHRTAASPSSSSRWNSLLTKANADLSFHLFFLCMLHYNHLHEKQSFICIRPA